VIKNLDSSVNNFEYFPNYFFLNYRIEQLLMIFFVHFKETKPIDRTIDDIKPYSFHIDLCNGTKKVATQQDAN
jgi:hypothetical protein